MALIAQLGEHCTGIAEVVGSNPAQSLNFFSGLCSSSVTAALALMTIRTQLLLMDKINFHPTILGPSITSTFKGLTRIRPLSCGFDSSVGRALHWHRRGRGFESRSEPEFFSGLCSSSVTATLALMTDCSNISRDILDSVFYHFSCTVYYIITFLSFTIQKR